MFVEDRTICQWWCVSLTSLSCIRMQVAHNGGVNRLRACPQLPHLLATLADTGAVHVWDVQTQIEQLATATAEAAKEAAGKAAVKTPPKQSFSGHKDEGYAVDWSPVTSGRLLSGDCAGVVHLWEPGNGKWAVGGTSFVAAAGSGFSDNPSVEDLQVRVLFYRPRRAWTLYTWMEKKADVATFPVRCCSFTCSLGVHV